jgi:protocatechuate 3,4-dioxygenase beta subunit
VDNTIPVTVEPGEDDMDNNFVDEELGTISGNVSEDTDNDDVADTPIADVTITLLDENGEEVATTTTDEDGNYEFTGVEPGDYTVVEQDETELDEDFVDVFDGDETPEDATDAVDGAQDDIIPVTVDAGEDDTDNNFVEEQLGTISGSVTLDTDNDDEGDAPQDGVTVTLLDENGEEVATTTTDEEGNFTFEGVEPGDYTVVTEDPADSQSVSDNDTTPEDATDGDDVVDNTIPVTVEPGEDDMNNDFVDEELGTISGSVTVDNADDPNTPLEDVVITLLDENGEEVATTTTDEDGNYEFTGVEPGDYTVTEEDPTGFFDVSDTDTTPDPDGDDGAAPNDEIPVTVDAGEDDADNDFVEELINAVVEVEKSTNGKDSDTAPGTFIPFFNGTEVDVNWEYVVTNNGNVDLINVTVLDDMEGEVCMIESLAVGESDTCTLTSIAMMGQYTNLATVTGQPIDPNSGEPVGETVEDEDPSNYFGVVFNIDKTSDRDTICPGEEVNYEVAIRMVNGLEGLQFRNINFVDNLLPDTLTVDSPEYVEGDDNENTFLDFGEEEFLWSYSLTLEETTTNIVMDMFDLYFEGDSIQAVMASDTAVVVADPSICASLGDFIFVDDNVNGIQDEEEEGLEGVIVNLLDGDGEPVLDDEGNPIVTTTDEDGFYIFEGLLAGDYQIEVEFPDDYLATVSNQGDDELDSDLDQDGLSEVVTISLGDQNLTVDGGLVLPASIGNFVWEDLDGDGVQDADEPGLPNVQVELSGTDIYGEEVFETMFTDEDGFYIFEGLVPGNYVLTILLEEPFTFTTQDSAEGDDASDSDANPTNGILTGDNGEDLVSNEENLTFDAGVVSLAQLGNFVWFDANNNGIQDEDEDGLNGVEVILYEDLDGDGVIDDIRDITTTTTNDGRDGYYQFTELVPGDYQVEFVTTDDQVLTVPDVNGFATDADDEDIDSDANPETGLSHVITLMSGDSDQRIDAGIFEELSLGNFVWNDVNNDGFFDESEEGIANVQLALWIDMNGNGLPDMNTGRTELTDADGFYLFEDLVPGNYVVQVVPQNLEPGGFLEEFETSTGNGQPTDPDDNVNNDDDGYDPNLGIGIISTAIELISRDEPTDDGDTDPNSNLTVDFGFFNDAKLGNYVWNDVNGNGIQDADDLGINGVTVNLYDANDPTTPIATTVTGENPDNATLQGYYLFEGLIPGDYFVEFITPEGNIITEANAAIGDELDSDVDGSNGPGTTATIELSEGEEDLTVDAGFYMSAKVGNYVWIDDMNAGDQDSQDDFDTGINGVTVNLYKTSDLITPVRTMMTTDGPDGRSGYYLFEDLEIGDYVIEVEKPEDFSFVVPNVGDDTVDSDIVDFFQGRTLDFTVNPGDCIEDIDAGLRLPVLPVEWMYIRGEWLENRDVNQISWATASEINSDYYIVERSYENEGFEDIGRVDSKGNTLSVTEYSFDDEDIDRDGQYYYRLRQVDLDGTIDYSDIVVITIARKGEFASNVYPNPAYRFVNINIETSELTDVQASILDISGKLVMNNVISGDVPAGKSEIRVPLDELPAGTYIVRITSGESVYNHKILVLNR